MTEESWLPRRTEERPTRPRFARLPGGLATGSALPSPDTSATSNPGIRLPEGATAPDC
jgi:hypothetical protein